jgi:NADPH2:quinone reductase
LDTEFTLRERYGEPWSRVKASRIPQGQERESKGSNVKAVQITSLNGPDAIAIADSVAPVASADQVLIKVHAAGASFPELLQTRGLYHVKPPLPYIPGCEVAGEIVSAPPSLKFMPGDRVAALPMVGGLPMLGGFAEIAVAQADMTFALPEQVSFIQGASLPLNYLTAYFALIERAGMRRGESVLVHGAAGGLGTAAIQMAKAFGADTVIAVTSTHEKGSAAVAAGADKYILADGFGPAVKELGGVDVVFDPVGGDRFTDSLRALKEDGRLLVIGFAAGSIPTVQVNRLLLNNITVVGAGWGTYAPKRPGHMQTEWEAILPHVRSRALNPVIGGTYPLNDAAAALRELDGRRAVGKIILTM